MSALYTDLSSADAASVVDSLSSRGVAVRPDRRRQDGAGAQGRGVRPARGDGRRGPAVVERGLRAARQPGHHHIGVPSAHRLPASPRGRAGQDADRDGRRASRRRCTSRCPTSRCSSTSRRRRPRRCWWSGKAVGGISGDEVEAIVHLVASSVKDMQPEDVTVIDANGTVLSAGGEGRDRIGGRCPGQGRERLRAARVVGSIMALLTRMTGPNKVAVTVTAQLDLDETPVDVGELRADRREAQRGSGADREDLDRGVRRPELPTVATPACWDPMAP